MSIGKFLMVLGLILTLSFSVFPAGKKVGVMWIGKSGMCEQVVSGFTDFLQKNAPEITVEYQKDLPDEAAALDVFNRFQEEMDGVVFLRSSGATFLANHPSKKPAFVGACTNPIELGVTKSLKEPSMNITGVTYYIPVKQTLSVLLKVFPNLKRVGLLVQDGHPSTRIDAEETRSACETEKIECHIIHCSKPEDLEPAIKSMTEKKVDMIILGNQNLFIDNASIAAQFTGNIPLISLAEKPVIEKHALCGLVPDDIKLGKMLGDAVVRVVKLDREISRVPFQDDPKPGFVVNMALAKKLGITIPETIFKYAKKIE